MKPMVSGITTCQRDRIASNNIGDPFPMGLSLVRAKQVLLSERVGAEGARESGYL